MAVIGTQAVKVQQEIMGADSRTWSPTGKMVGTDPATYAPTDSFLVYTPPGVTLAQADAEVDVPIMRLCHMTLWRVPRDS